MGPKSGGETWIHMESLPSMTSRSSCALSISRKLKLSARRAARVQDLVDANAKA